MTAVEHGYVSSSLVKEIAAFGGDVSGMIPAAAVDALRRAARPCDNPRRRPRGAAHPPPAARSLDATEGTPIDIIFLVERLESIIANGKKLPLTNNVVVDQAAALGLIDELRVAVPEEVRAAKRINSEGERIIEKAQEEAERIVARAQEQAAFLIDERGLTQQAEAESRRIVERRRAPTPRRSGAAPTNTRSTSSSASKATSCKTLQSIKRGIELLDTRRADLRAGERGRGEPDDGSTTRPRRIDEDEGATAPPGGDRRRGGAPRTPAARLERGRPPRRAGRVRPRLRVRRRHDRSAARTSTWPRPIEGRVHLTRTNRGLLVDADTSHVARAEECSRCLRDIVVPIVARAREGGPAVDRPPDRPARPARARGAG